LKGSEGGEQNTEELLQQMLKAALGVACTSFLFHATQTCNNCSDMF